MRLPGYGHRVSSRLRPVLCLLGCLAVLATACGASPSSPSPTEPRVDDRAVQLQRLRRAVDTVAEAQARADAEVLNTVDLMRTVDSAVPGMLSAETIDATVDAWKSTGGLLDPPEEPPDLRSGYLQLAAEVDDARAALATARRRLDDPWELEYLDAQDTVLTAVREYAEAGDHVAQLTERHWSTYVWFHGEMESFVERRWFFRSAQEARDAFQVEVDTRLDDLAAAQREMDLVRSDRETAARAVNDATAQARSVWARRPSEQPTLGEQSASDES